MLTPLNSKNGSIEVKTDTIDPNQRIGAADAEFDILFRRMGKSDVTHLTYITDLSHFTYRLTRFNSTN